MAKARYGKKPKITLNEKEKKTPPKQQKKGKRDEKKRALINLTPKQTKIALWASIGFCMVFIVVATVYIVNEYALITRKTKIDLYNEPHGYNDVTRELSKLQQKYRITDGVANYGKMNKVDAFNYKLLEFTMEQSNYNLMALNAAQNFTTYESRYERGKAVKAPLNDLTMMLVPITYETAEHSFTIDIDGTIFESGYVDTPANYFYTVPYNTAEGTRVIICEDSGTGGFEGRTFIYFYDGDKAFFAGELPVQANQVEFSDDGYLSYSREFEMLQASVYKAELYLDADNDYALTDADIPETGYYNIPYCYLVFLREDLTVYTEPSLSSSTAVIPETSVLEIIGTDTQAFMRCRTADGSFYFINAAAPDTVYNNGAARPAKDVMFGLK